MAKTVNINNLIKTKNNLLDVNNKLTLILEEINTEIEDIELIINTPKSKKNITYLKDYFDREEYNLKEYGEKFDTSLQESINLYSKYLENTKKNVGGNYE